MVIDNHPQTVITVISQRRQLWFRLETTAIPGHMMTPADESRELVRSLRGPVLIDTVGLLPVALTTILAGLVRSPHPAIAVVSPGDSVALHLCTLCPAVQLLIADSAGLELLRPWIMHVQLARGVAHHRRIPHRISLPPPETPSLVPDLLPMLAALEYAATLEDAADRCGQSRATLCRQLRRVRATLGLPPGAETRFAPSALARAIYAALGASSVAGPTSS